MLGLILVNAFMFVQGRFLTNLFAKVVSVPQEILTPIIVMFCFAGAFSVNKSYFDVLVALVFCAVAWLLRKIDFRRCRFCWVWCLARWRRPTSAAR